MIYADDKFILELAGKRKPLAELRPDDQHVDIVVLSDIHLGDEAGVAAPTFAEAAASFGRLKGNFERRYAELKGELYVEGDPRVVDLVVQCGDLIEGAVVGKWLAEGAADQVYGAVFDQLVVPSLLATRDNDQPIVCIPGNHDLYRRGARIRPKSINDVMTAIEPTTTGQKTKAFYFYDHVARPFLDKGHAPGSDWLNPNNAQNPTQLPALSLSAVFTKHIPASDPTLSSYLAVIGLDSNFAEYCNDGAENLGEISDLQLANAHKLICALATRCSDAPLHIILAVHHHLLPVENKRLAQTRADALRGFEGRSNLECRDYRPGGLCLRGRFGGCPKGAPSGFCLDKWLAAEASRSTMLNGSRIIQFCHEHRVSALLHGHMHQEQVLWVSRQSFNTRQFDETLAVIACPSFKRGQHAEGKRPMIEGMVRLRLRPAENAIEVGYSGNPANEDARAPSSPHAGMQVLAPLLSASRISDGERRLYLCVRDTIKAEMSALKPDNARHAALAEFDNSVTAFYRTHGYVRVTPGPELRAQWDASKASSLFERPHQVKRYNFLLLLREQDECVEILLSHHRPLRHPRMGNWDTLLMPAFQSVDDLLEHLGNDVARLHEGAISIRTAKNVQQITAKIDDLVRQAEDERVAVWENEIDQLDTRVLTKISPTDGTITQYQYTLVSLRPLTTAISELHTTLTRDLDDSGGDDDVGGVRDQPAGEDISAITKAMDNLPRIVLGDVKANALAPQISIRALQADGSGLRWDGRPTWSAQGEEPTTRGEAAVKVPKGLVWFPLLAKNGDALQESGWRSCPSIVARNADVMDWVESYVRGYIANKRVAQGGPRLKLELETNPEEAKRKARPSIQGVRTFPFADNLDALPERPPGNPRDVIASPPSSLSRAMSMVPFNPELDLGFDESGAWAYRGLPLARVFLVRSTDDRGRPLIKVFSAEAVERRSIGKRRNPHFWPDFAASQMRPEHCLGVLRPVQRYVTRNGLLRAREVNRHVLNTLEDPWGYAHALPRTGNARLAVTPPIIELLAPEEYEGDGGPSNQEFILCDGNHRVVEQVWGVPRRAGESELEHAERRNAWRTIGLKPHDGFAICAVAVAKAPTHPYYARPFSRYEWDITADNVLDAPPELHAKYAPRRVLDEQLSPRSRPALRGRKDLFRRYYRQLELGFGYLGGQAGKAG